MTSDLEKCKELKNIFTHTNNNIVVNPQTNRNIDITKITFKQKKQLCKILGIDFDSISQSTSDTFNNTESFTQLQKTIKDNKLDINDCIKALLQKIQKTRMIQKTIKENTYLQYYTKIISIL